MENEEDPDWAIEISSDYDSEPTITPAGLSGLDADLREQPGRYRSPSNFDRNSPIEDALVDDLVGPTPIYRNLGREELTERAVWMRARIDRRSLGRGQATSSNPDLASAIRDRGPRDGSNHHLDDCGHMLGNRLGGPMRHYNLFPQARPINRGNRGLYHLWRSLEQSILGFIHANPESHVTLEVRLYYDDSSEYPNRPIRYKVRARFFTKKKEEEQSEIDDNHDQAIIWLSHQLSAMWDEVKSVITTIENDPDFYRNLSGKDSEEAREEMAKMSLRDLLVLCDAVMEKLNVGCQIGFGTVKAGVGKMPFKRYVEIFDLHVHSSTTLEKTSDAGRSLSFWDFVPVVSSIRTLCDAANAQNDTVFWTNTVLGVGGLALDVVSLGSAGLAIGATKVAGQQLVKGVLSGVAKQAGKQAAREVAKRVAIAAATEAAVVAAGAAATAVLARTAANKIRSEINDSNDDIGRSSGSKKPGSTPDSKVIDGHSPIWFFFGPVPK